MLHARLIFTRQGGENDDHETRTASAGARRSWVSRMIAMLFDKKYG